MDSSTVINILIFALAAWFIYSRFAPTKGLKTLKDPDFQKELQQKDNFLADVREPHEYQRGHIQGAVNIPLSQLRNRINDFPNDKPIYLYCQSGMRSKQAAKILSKSGKTQLAHLLGVISAYSGKVVK
ncbi:rhodanese-like domain-containing protein [Ferviditalea candida]|uniref:Rhodanese-like domain-containing protein n=1 Tax=Ferviditalea candida TaxID=3108399 RepID=A0ABU5ZHN0_9BACL|nr:rhodanese-like domain-containing protein [Paenibacillaceae bacterium T2]